MKLISLISFIFIPLTGFAQVPEVIVFKHELRWTNEARFPNYFLLPEVRDEIFDNTGPELRNLLGTTDIKFPDVVEYNIISGFGKQKAEMPKKVHENDTVIGIFSFITRATSGFAMFWNFRIIIKKGDKIILNNEVSHELEYFNPSGYMHSQRWISPREFEQIFSRLVKETLGLLPYSNEKIILGSAENVEEKVRSQAPHLSRNLLKIRGAWETGGNFSALLESENYPPLEFNFREGFLWELPVPSFSSLLADLFTEITGIDFLYEQKVKYQLNGTLIFSDDQKFGIKLKWIDIETRSAGSGEIIYTISNPVIAELYDQRAQTGYFAYTLIEKIIATDKTTEKFNIYSGTEIQNTLGIERIHSIKGSLSGIPVSAEFNESDGIIVIKSDESIIGAMVVINCNPENTSVSNQQLSKNKRFIKYTSQNITKPSMEDDKKVEWYPLYLNGNSLDDSGKTCIKTLICLLFAMGNITLI